MHAKGSQSVERGVQVEAQLLILVLTPRSSQYCTISLQTVAAFLNLRLTVLSIALIAASNDTKGLWLGSRKNLEKSGALARTLHPRELVDSADMGIVGYIFSDWV